MPDAELKGAVLRSAFFGLLLNSFLSTIEADASSIDSADGRVATVASG